MPRLLDIIVPHYNEPLEIVKPFFEMIKNQRGIDFHTIRVWLVEDGHINILPDEYINQFDFVERVILPHNGVSAARNWGIDNADSEWICFCDCDDCYTSILALYNILYILGQESSKACDLMWNAFYQIGLQKISICSEYNTVFIHNKYYRLSFLREYNIRFNENLYMSEDSAFNMIVNMEIGDKTIGKINTPSPLYAWCRRLGSITMDFDKWLSNTEGHFNRNLYVLEEYRKRNKPNQDKMIARVITDAYSMLNKTGMLGDPSAFIKRVSDFYKENKETFDNISEDILNLALNASDNDAGITYNNKVERLPIHLWIRDYLE